MSLLDFLFRSEPKPTPPRRHIAQRIECLPPQSGPLLHSKTPSSDRLPSLRTDPFVEALRVATFTDAGRTYARLSSDDAQEFLAELLSDSEASPDAVRLHQQRAGSFPCVIVELPRPRTAGRAFYAALLVTLAARKTPETISPRQVRYFTLEKRTDDANDPATVFCEWTADGERRSFGSGPPPKVDRFLYALSGMRAESS